MHAIVITMLALAGADARMSYGGGEGADSASYMDGCDECGNGHMHGHHLGTHGCYLGPMPQSCYNPSYGCYPSTRFMHRYPAFHGTYYRAAYNYRNYFDYPWHAGLHEPTSHFSYHVPGEAPLQAVPAPAPAARTSGKSNGVSSASVLVPGNSSSGR
jgi:hypothetical protein